MFVHRDSYLVYKYTSRNSPYVDLPVGIEVTYLDESTIHRFFAQDERLSGVFTKFAIQGFVGLVLHEGDNWITYGWLSTPYSRQPVHLPSWIKRLNVYWIYYCRTKDQCRGRGFYKLALRLLVGHVLSKGEPTVYIDTEQANIASRRAILSTGFQPCGVMQCTSYGIPWLRHYTVGKWSHTAQHPELIM
jgi:hypothetical protein